MKEIYQEDVRSIALEALELVQSKLKGYDIILKPEQEDKIYVPLIEAIDSICNYPDYRSNM